MPTFFPRQNTENQNIVVSSQNSTVTNPNLHVDGNNDYSLPLPQHDSPAGYREAQMSMSLFFFIHGYLSMHVNFHIGHDSLFCIARRPVLDSLRVNDLGDMNTCCRFCNALHWLDERVSPSTISSNDPRRYNLPTADEVGVILPGQNIFQGHHRDIIIHL